MLAVSTQQRIPDILRVIDVNSEAGLLYKKLCGYRDHASNRQKILDNMYILGNLCSATVGTNKKSLIEKEIGPVHDYQVFHRMELDKRIVHCLDYSAVKRRNNFTILYGQGHYGFVKCFLKCATERAFEYIALVQRLEAVALQSVPLSKFSHITPVTKTDLYVAIRVCNIKAVCVHMDSPSSNVSFVAKSPNVVERE